MNRLRPRLIILVFAAAAIWIGFVGGNALLQRVGYADVQAERKQLQAVEDISTVFRHVGKVVEPSVVNIQVRKTVHAVSANPPDDLLRRFFRDHPQDLPNPQDAPENNDEFEIGTGSGVIIETQGDVGYILTNNHVAGGASDMVITLSDGREIKNGKVLGTDVKSDLAVVQIKADGLIPAVWGNSDEVEKGDWVLAFGSPFGYVGSMTHGIVSAKDRHDVGILSQNDYEDFIQVDAPINPGNSGGPLVNLHGEVVGINTAIATTSRGFQGIGFAIPSNQAKPVYTQLKNKGKVIRGWLGVAIKDVAVDLPVARSFGYTGDKGVLVEDTFPNTPAYGKLQKGDIITGINDGTVENVQQLRNLVAATPPGTDVHLKVFRDGKTQDVKLALGDQPEDISVIPHGRGDAPGQTPATGSADVLGMKLETLNEQMAAQLNLPGLKGGAVVTDVKRDSLAAKATVPIQPYDVITMVGSTAVHSAQEAADALNKANAAVGIRLYVVDRTGGHYTFIQGQTADH